MWKSSSQYTLKNKIYEPRQEENSCIHGTDKCKLNKIKTNNPIEEKQEVWKGNVQKKKSLSGNKLMKNV